MTFRYLLAETVIEINHRVGGRGPINHEGIEANCFRPASGFGDHELFPDVWSKAAAYVHAFATTQYFDDGNKRTAWVAADTFLAGNGIVLPRIPTIEAEFFVRGVAADVFNNDEDRDATIPAAAEWLRSTHERHRVGPAVAPGLEWVMLASHVQYVTDFDRDPFRGDMVPFTIVGGGMHTLVALEGFPAPAELVVTGRMHWRRDQHPAGRSLRTTVVAAEEGLPRVNRPTQVITVDQWGTDHHGDWVPTVFIVPVRAVFLGIGRYEVMLFLDDALIARLPIMLATNDPVPEDLSALNA